MTRWILLLAALALLAAAPSAHAQTDNDGDGAFTPQDCDDNDSTIYPGAPEIPADGIDQDCDGADACYQDLDGDGYGSTIVIPGNDFDCSDAGESSRSDDCNDVNSAIYPGAPEIPADGIDQDCDGADACYQDLDGDGYGSTIVIPGNDFDCSDAGESSRSDDCNDGNSAMHPGATDLGGEDLNCDGIIDGPVATEQRSWGTLKGYY